jgi:hypothetical protein
MPQGNYWSQQVAIAAIEALTRLDLIGIVTLVNGPTWTHPLQEWATRRRRSPPRAR